MFNIVIKETKEFLRDKTNLFFFMLFPVLLVFLLGNLLGSMDKAEEAIGTIQIQYIIETANPMQVASIESFIKQVGEDGTISFVKASELTKAKELAATDKITAVVMFDGEPLNIQVYEGTNRIKNRSVGAILNSFIQTNKTVQTVLKTSPAALANLSIDNSESYVEQKNLGVKRSMLDYYAVSMVAMISFMSILVGAGAFVGERQNKTLNRLIIAPQNRVFLFLQKIFGMIPQVVLQILVIMILSVVFFQAHYAATLGDNLYLFLLFFVVTLCMVSVGAVVGIVIKANPMLVIFPVLWIMMFLGGTYSKEVNIAGVTDLMPIYQIQQAAFDLAVFGRYTKATNAILICLGVMAVALTLGAFLFSKKEEER